MLRRTIFNTLKYLFFLLVLAKSYFEISHCSAINDHREVQTLIMCPEIEKQALELFKQSLKDNGNLLSTWNDEVSCCMWKGVVCNNLTGHVHELHLQGYYDQYVESFEFGNGNIPRITATFQARRGLRGKINPSLVNLKYLNYLNLSQNDFGETMPSFIGSLVNLEYLDLSEAGFHGAIPRTIGNLSNLRTLSLRSEFTGTYSDNLDWLSGLSKLEHLNMSYVDLSKSSNWLHVINTLPSLLELRFENCRLDLSASVDFVNLSSLHTLDLSFNNYVSSHIVFPRWTLQLAGLKYLSLSGNSIEGPIPGTSNTTLLESIDLSWNHLNSTIPNWLYSCNNLEVLNLQVNFLVGTISHDISNLTSLIDVILPYNNFYGNLPPGVWRSCNMHSLDLSNNKLQGEMSDVIGNMSDCFMGDLVSLLLSENQFSGHLCYRFRSFKNLQYLDLSYTSMSGVIPFVLGELLSLKYLYLSGNKFDGNLPENLGQMSKLEYFDVSNNLLEGVVTERHLIDLKNLKSFDVSQNQLTFEVSSSWIPPFQLWYLSLHSTNLRGSFPSWLRTQKYFDYLDLSNSGIHGIVPNWVWHIPKMNLSHNNLYGNIPNLNFVNMYVFLSSNSFSGPLPHIASSVLQLDLSNNSISGEISSTICDNNTTESYALEVLHLGGNRLSGELPDCWMRLKNLRLLNLRDNDLYGGIRSSIELLTNLYTLNLRNNRISGNIPRSIFKSKGLVNIDLSSNYFYGNLPKWQNSNSIDLRIIILRSNRLSGRINSDICSFSSLQILDLSNNSFYGTIPRCLHKFTSMVQNGNPASLDVRQYTYINVDHRGYYYRRYSWSTFIESLSITTKGHQRQYDVLLRWVTYVDLSNNNLSGDIPLELTRLVSLRFLNLSRNHLTGLIPSDIGNMKQLESLDLSLNSLTGGIPSSFSAMSFLNDLNLSYNNLTGRIPESTQLLRMDASSFIENNLCGPPLTSKCDWTDHGNNAASDDVVESHKIEVDWFIVLLSLGYTIGLSSFLVVLIFKKTLREAYFEMLDDVWLKIMSSLKCS